MGKACDAIAIFCDQSKAFDCVDYRTLFAKLRYCGLNDRALKSIVPYLKARLQNVQIRNT